MIANESGPDALRGLIEELGPRACAATAARTADAADYALVVATAHYDGPSRAASIEESSAMQDLKQLFSDLIRFETELWNAIDARMRAEHDLPLHKFEPMQIIAGTPDCRVYDIAAALSLTTGGVSKLVDSIEASGYARRRPNPADRRSSIVELTPAGRKALARATSTFEAELEARLRSALPDHLLAQFSSSLTSLRTASAHADDSAAA